MKIFILCTTNYIHTQLCIHAVIYTFIHHRSTKCLLPDSVVLTAAELVTTLVYTNKDLVHTIKCSVSKSWQVKLIN